MLGRLAAVLTLSFASLCGAQSTREEFAALAAAHGGTIKLNSQTYDAITSPDRDWSVAIELTATVGTQVACAPCMYVPDRVSSRTR
jgi:oligosaccharyltransferase complex subunit gamma